MPSETEKYYRAKNRDRRVAQWIILIVLGVPFALVLGTCVGFMAR